MNDPALEAVEKAEQEGLRKHGWYVHIHQDPTNYHTHGLASKYKDALDFQIVRNINHVLANVIFWEFVDKLETGEKLVVGGKYTLSQFDMVVMLAYAPEGGRVVTRIILPDLDGKLKKEEMSPEYAEQWKGAIS